MAVASLKLRTTQGFDCIRGHFLLELYWLPTCRFASLLLAVANYIFCVQWPALPHRMRRAHSAESRCESEKRKSRNLAKWPLSHNEEVYVNVEFRLASGKVLKKLI